MRPPLAIPTSHKQPKPMVCYGRQVHANRVGAWTEIMSCINLETFLAGRFIHEIPHVEYSRCWGNVVRQNHDYAFIYSSHSSFNNTFMQTQVFLFHVHLSLVYPLKHQTTVQRLKRLERLGLIFPVSKNGGTIYVQIAECSSCGQVMAAIATIIVCWVINVYLIIRIHAINVKLKLK